MVLQKCKKLAPNKLKRDKVLPWKDKEADVLKKLITVARHQSECCHFVTHWSAVFFNNVFGKIATIVWSHNVL